MRAGKGGRVIGADTPGEEALAERHLAPHFPLAGNSREGFVYRYLETGLCAYSPHHHRLLDAIRRASPVGGGVTFTGDYWRGASIEACFRAAEEAVAALAAG